jgi:hypothetical protein
MSREFPGGVDIFAYLRGELSRRIMIIDGAMGTMIQVGACSLAVSGTPRNSWLVCVAIMFSAPQVH